MGLFLNTLKFILGFGPKKPDDQPNVPQRTFRYFRVWQARRSGHKFVNVREYFFRCDPEGFDLDQAKKAARYHLSIPDTDLLIHAAASNSLWCDVDPRHLQELKL